MLNDVRGFSRIIIACECADLRRGLDGLAAVLQKQFQLDSTEENVSFLSAGQGRIGSKVSFLEKMDIFSYKKGSPQVTSVGPVPKKEPWLSHENNLTC